MDDAFDDDFSEGDFVKAPELSIADYRQNTKKNITNSFMFVCIEYRKQRNKDHNVYT